MKKKEVIIVTDGDLTAQEAIEEASQELDLRVVSKSAGNPTPLSGQKILEMIEGCPTDPVVVMFDDNGDLNCGDGETALRIVISSDKIKVLGVLAVASNSKKVAGVNPDFSVTKEGKIVKPPVDKNGTAEPDNHQFLEGDTVDTINQLQDTIIVGIGDLGKMEGQDDVNLGAPVTKKALREILIRSGRQDGEED
ncbi:stage V sporulation protein SpoVABEA [Halanaerocella petrolearia]